MASELTRSGATNVLNNLFQKASVSPGVLQLDLLFALQPDESIISTKLPFAASSFFDPLFAGGVWQSSHVASYTLGDNPGDDLNASYSHIAIGSGAGKGAPNTLDIWMAEANGGTNPPAGGVTFTANQIQLYFEGFDTPPASGKFYVTTTLARDLLFWMLASHLPFSTYTLATSSSWTISFHTTTLSNSVMSNTWNSVDASSPISGASGTFFQNTSDITITTNSGSGVTSYTVAGGNPVRWVSISVGGSRYFVIELTTPLDVPAGSTVTIPTGQLNVGFGHIS